MQRPPEFTGIMCGSLEWIVVLADPKLSTRLRYFTRYWTIQRERKSVLLGHINQLNIPMNIDETPCHQGVSVCGR